MSMKVYNAYRLKRTVDLWPFLWRLKHQALANIRAALKQHYTDLVLKMDYEDPEYRKDLAAYQGQTEHGFRLSRVRDAVRTAFRENLTRSDRSTYSLEVVVAIYPHKGRYYLRTFCDPCSVVGDALNFVETLPELEEYHYQNQSDAPAEVSARNWAARKKVWNEIFSDYGSVGDYVTLEILTWNSFYLADTWIELSKEWLKNPPRLPSREEVWADRLRALASLKDAHITFEPGLIQGPDFTLTQDAGEWLVLLKKFKPRRYPTLNQAASQVDFEYQPESTKRFVRNMMSQTKEQRRAKRQAAKK